MGAKPRVGTRSVATALMVVVLLIGAAPGANARTWSKRLARGVRLTTIVRRHPRLHARVASIDPRGRFTIRPVLATGKLPGLARTSSIARHRRAVVAVNGDYARPSGRPVFTFAQNGSLKQTPLGWGRNFALTPDGSRAFIGHPGLKVWLAGVLDEPLHIDRVNQGSPGWFQLAMNTDAGGMLERPAKRMCYARLLPRGFPHLVDGSYAIAIDHVVDRAVCRYRPLSLLGGKGVVVSAKRGSPRAKELMSVSPGQSVSLRWSLGWDDVKETIGGNPTLIENGRIVVDSSRLPFYRRAPRTAVAVTRDKRILLATVDGRHRKRSRGITPVALARLLRKKFNATWALNLDGGGSTTMVVRGRIVNRPSDGRERPVSSALVVVPRGQKVARRSTKAAPVSSKKVWHEIASDPASTGGLAYSVERRGRKLDAGLRAASRDFKRSSRN